MSIVYIPWFVFFAFFSAMMWDEFTSELPNTLELLKEYKSEIPWLRTTISIIIIGKLSLIFVMILISACFLWSAVK